MTCDYLYNSIKYATHKEVIGLQIGKQLVNCFRDWNLAGIPPDILRKIRIARDVLISRQRKY
jgi:hypothetical protein